MLSITQSAIHQLKRVLCHSGKNLILFSAKSGGCSGFEYKFTPTNTISNPKNIYKCDDLTVEICDSSMLYLLGTEIDWRKDIMGEGFKFKNPGAVASCGCGSSFTPF